MLKIEPKKYTGEFTIVSMRMPGDMVNEIDGIAQKTGYTRMELMLLCLEFSLRHMKIVQEELVQMRPQPYFCSG